MKLLSKPIPHFSASESSFKIVFDQRPASEISKHFESNLPRIYYLFSFPSSSLHIFLHDSRVFYLYPSLPPSPFSPSIHSFLPLPPTVLSPFIGHSRPSLSSSSTFYIPDSPIPFSPSDTSFFRFPQISSASDKPIDHSKGVELSTHWHTLPSSIPPPFSLLLLLCATLCEHYSLVFLCSPPILPALSTSRNFVSSRSLLFRVPYSPLPAPNRSIMSTEEVAAVVVAEEEKVR